MAEIIAGVERSAKFEIINGVVNMVPPGTPDHASISGNAYNSFYNYFKGRKCKVYHDNNWLRLDIIKKKQGMDLPEKDKVIPDIMVVCDRSMDTPEGVTGAPALIAEVLSPSTQKKDRTYKKDMYELIGVPEYWIISPGDKSVEIYILAGGKYELRHVYRKFTEDELRWFEEGIREKPDELAQEFSPCTFPDLKIKIDDIFYDLIGGD